MVCPAIDRPSSCETCSVIRFLRAKNMSAAQIRPELRAVYSRNVMSEGTLTQLRRMFKDGRINVHGVERSGRPSLVSDDLFQSESRRLTIS
jgi:hypothetical protein